MSNYKLHINDNVPFRSFDVDKQTFCTSPHWITNPYTMERVFVPCGRCSSCKASVANKNIGRIIRESSMHKYQFMLTLTYDNSHLPYYTMVNPDDNYQFKLNILQKFNDIYESEPFETSLKDVFFESENLFFVSNRDSLPPFDYSLFQKIDGFAKEFEAVSSMLPPTNFPCVEPTFAVGCKKDLQDFLKRLRRQIEYYFKKRGLSVPKFRYFFVCEYGPHTLRPHYHAILWFDDDLLSKILKQFVYKAWKMCSCVRIQCEPCADPSGSYVAKYITGNYTLPNYLQTPLTRTFTLKSKNLGFDALSNEVVFSSAIGNRCRVDIFDSKTKAYTCDMLPSEIVRRCFPKPYGYTFNSLYFKSSLLQGYEQYKNIKSSLIDDILYHRTKRNPFKFLSYLSWTNYEKTYTIIINHSAWHSSTLQFYLAFERYYLPYVKKLPGPLVRQNDYDSILSYLTLCESVWKEYKQNQLKQWFEFQEIFLKSHSLRELFYLYPNVLDFFNVNEILCYWNQSEQCYYFPSGYTMKLRGYIRLLSSFNLNVRDEFGYEEVIINNRKYLRIKFLDDIVKLYAMRYENSSIVTRSNSLVKVKNDSVIKRKKYNDQYLKNFDL